MKEMIIFILIFRLMFLSKDVHRIGIIRVEKKDGEYVVTRPNSEVEELVDNVEVISVGEMVKSDFISFSGTDFESTLIKVSINVSESSLRPLLWGDSVVMDPDDKNVTRLIVGKYKELYSFVKNNDFDSFLKEASPAWIHTAYAFGMSTDIDDIIMDSEADKMFIRDSVNGHLNDFNFNEDDFKFEWTYGNRLVRILPKPLTWGDEEKFTSSPLLYMNKNGEIKIAYIAFD
jgi:hypothetical protein